MHGIESISTIIDRKARETALGKSVEATRVCQIFNEAVSDINPRLAEKTEALHVKNNVLLVAIPSSAWAQELMMCQHKIVKKINNDLKEKVVRRIRYQVRRRDVYMR